jgi:hypothetical protein
MAHNFTLVTNDSRGHFGTALRKFANKGLVVENWAK